MKTRTAPLLGFIVLTLAPADDAKADTWCAGNSGELFNALLGSALNSEADVIRLEAGTYVSGSPDGFEANPNDRDLEISGGWSAGCLFRPTGSRSTIDGEYQRLGLRIHGDLGLPATVRVAHMSFIRGASDEAGGLSINAIGTADMHVEVENCRFHDNHLDGQNEYTGAGLRINADTVSVLGNVFTDNDAEIAGGAVAISCFGALGAFTNNTVTGNTAAFGTATDRGGASLHGNCLWEVANNILWGNDGYDLSIGDDEAVLRNNDLDDLNGVPADSSGNMNVNPQFVSSGILRLRRSSPLIDAGLNETLLGLPLRSFDGGPREVGPCIDIGAYELDMLFNNGFDPAFSLR
jgi:hypothetical protein